MHHGGILLRVLEEGMVMALVSTAPGALQQVERLLWEDRLHHFE